MRTVGTTSRGVRCPVVREGDDLVKIVTDAILACGEEQGLTFHAVTAEARTALVDAVNDAYEQKLQERMEQSEDAPAHGMEQQM